MERNTAYRLAVGLALTSAFLIVWLNPAAGLIGIDYDDPVNFALELPNTAGSAQILILHGVFVALFAGAALLLRYTARGRYTPRPRGPRKAGDSVSARETR